MSVHSSQNALVGATRVEVQAEPSSLEPIWSRDFVRLLVIQFAFGLGFSVFYLLPKFLRLELHAKASEIGLVTGVGLVAAVVATPLVALCLRSLGQRVTALLGVGSMSVAAIGFIRVTQFGLWLLTLRVLQGLAFALFLTAMVTRAAELVPKSRLGQAMGYVGLAALVTNALSPLLAEPLAARCGWSAVFLMASVFGACALVLTFGLRDAPNGSPAHNGNRFGWFDQRMAAILYATAVCGVAIGVMFTFTQPLVIERGAIDVGRFFSGYVAGATAVRLALSSLADRMGRVRVSVVALVAYALVIALTAAVTPEGLLWAGTGLGICHGLLYPALNALVLERAGIDDRGTIASLFGGAFSLGYAVSVLGLGVVADTLGYATVYGITALIALSGAGALLWLTQTRSLHRDRDIAGSSLDVHG